MTIEDKIIFFDTSIFESENYFEGRKINILFNLAKNGLIHLKMTDVVYREILTRIENHTTKAVNLFKKEKLNFEREARILRNTNVLNEHFEKVDFKTLKETANKQIKEKLIGVINESKIEIIDSSIVDVKEILNDYFETNPPFKEGLKKNEFPDAISINAIKKWCENTSNTAIHLSSDNDFKKIETSYIDCSHDLSSLAYSEIENDPFFEEVDIDFLGIDDLDIDIGVMYDVEEDSFSYEIEMNILFSVNASYTDLTSAYYDKEDGIWWGEERITTIKKYSVNTLVYADYKLEKNKIDGYFKKITDFEFRDIEEI